MFNQFKAATGFKHILSFGGWAFSTSAQTYPIFRQGVTPAERQTFATNVANVSGCALLFTLTKTVHHG
jgi:chitinase